LMGPFAMGLPHAWGGVTGDRRGAEGGRVGRQEGERLVVAKRADRLVSEVWVPVEGLPGEPGRSGFRDPPGTGLGTLAGLLGVTLHPPGCSSCPVWYVMQACGGAAPDCGGDYAGGRHAGHGGIFTSFGSTPRGRDRTGLVVLRPGRKPNTLACRPTPCLPLRPGEVRLSFGSGPAAVCRVVTGSATRLTPGLLLLAPHPHPILYRRAGARTRSSRHGGHP